jgi:AcrR family transcriptional regulator
MTNLSRTERKRQRTRQALIDATRKLARTNRLEKISVQDITELADVGLGTFYNYFEHKKAIFDAVLDDLQRDFDNRLENFRTNLKDPAMLVAAVIRYTLEQATSNEDWHLFLRHSGRSPNEFLRQHRDQCQLDVESGVNAGRFKIGDISFTCQLILGSIEHVVIQQQGRCIPPQEAEEAVRCILRMLGLSDIVARALAQSPLPPASAPKRAPLPEFINWSR